MSFVVDAHADRATLGVVGEREENVFLPAVSDEEAAQRGVPQHAVSVLHSQGSPVEAAAFELGCGLCDDLTVLLGGEGGEVGQIHRGSTSTWVRSRGGPVLELLRLCVE